MLHFQFKEWNQNGEFIFYKDDKRIGEITFRYRKEDSISINRKLQVEKV